MITFFCIFYYVFSLFFMIGYFLDNVEHNPWFIIAGGIICIVILAPILLPLNLGTFISRNSD